jgi:hypothetical protein
MMESNSFCPATAMHWHDWWIHAVGFSREERQIMFDVDAGIEWTVEAGNIATELVQRMPDGWDVRLSVPGPAKPQRITST